MSVTLNEVALRFFLDSEQGPVGTDLRERAENVTRLAEQNASGDIIGIDTGDLHSGIRYELRQGEEGLEAVIGTDARHNGFAYPTYWDENGKPWLTFALIDGFDFSV